MGNPATNTGHKTRVKVKTRQEVQTPSLFKVLMHNDDYTTMEFVVEVLQDVFHKNWSDAEQIMLTIHYQGVGHCGTYPFAVAEIKAELARRKAREAGFPLRCSLEEA